MLRLRTLVSNDFLRLRTVSENYNVETKRNTSISKLSNFLRTQTCATFQLRALAHGARKRQSKSEAQN